MLSSLAAISLTFFSSGPLTPKYVAICTSCFGSTKSLASEQNFSSVGLNSRQVIDFGIDRPSRQVPSGANCKQNSQIFKGKLLSRKSKTLELNLVETP